MNGVSSVSQVEHFVWVPAWNLSAETLRIKIANTIDGLFPGKERFLSISKRPQLSQPWKASDRSARDCKPRNIDFAAAEVAENRQVGGLQTVFSKLNGPLGGHAGPGGGSEILDLAGPDATFSAELQHQRRRPGPDVPRPGLSWYHLLVRFRLAPRRSGRSIAEGDSAAAVSRLS